MKNPKNPIVDSIHRHFEIDAWQETLKQPIMKLIKVAQPQAAKEQVIKASAVSSSFLSKLSASAKTTAQPGQTQAEQQAHVSPTPAPKGFGRK